MAKETMYELHNRWRGFTADKARAKRAIQEQDDRDNAEITRLREQIIQRNTEFEETWRKMKADLQQARDEAVMAELAIPGRSAQGILRDLGSNNTVWIYDLRARIQADKPWPAMNMNAPTPEEGQESAPSQATFVEDDDYSEYSDIVWQYHNHQGVVGWLLSGDYSLVKKYGAPKTSFEDQWFIADRETKEFLFGSRELFDATPKGEITRKSKLLESLLEETYTGKIKEVENVYTS